MTTDPRVAIGAGDPQATFCATLVDEWVRGGVRHAAVAPGSRSTPMSLALARDGRIDVHVFHDERAASFAAVGMGRAAGAPAVVVTTSGTAAVQCHAAVVEADLSGVPLVVVTADRPRHLWGVGAPQTITQEGLFGASVRMAASPGLADPARAEPTWRSLAARSLLAAMAPPGPVHLDLEFDEPLLGDAGPLPAGRADGAAWHRAESPVAMPPLIHDARLLDVARGVIIAGGVAMDPGPVHALAAAVGWPVLADPRSGARIPSPTTVSAFDAVLRSPTFAARHRPDLVLQLGPPPASRVLAEWVATASDHGAEHVVVDGAGRWVDPTRGAAGVVAADPAEMCRRLADSVTEAVPPTSWLGDWQRAERVARDVLAPRVTALPVATEPGVAAGVVAALPDGAHLVVASSMPVRDVEWYAAPRTGITVSSNRGANGIDGVVSTAVGTAVVHPGPVVALVGDVAFLHDSTALIGLADRHLDLTVVVVDNDGGGIFSFLPQAAALDGYTFELLFGTPHGADLVGVARAHGLAALDAGTAVPSWTDVFGAGGTSVVRVATTRRANVDEHDRLHHAVVEALVAEGLG